MPFQTMTKAHKTIQQDRYKTEGIKKKVITKSKDYIQTTCTPSPHGQNIYKGLKRIGIKLEEELHTTQGTHYMYIFIRLYSNNA